MGRHLQQRGTHLTEPTIESYVSGMAAQLKQELPEVDADEIVAETRSHLKDRVRDLVAEGFPASKAEATALAGFGDGRVFARNVARSRMATQSSAWVSRIGLISLIGLFVSTLVLSFTLQREPSATPFWHESLQKELFTRNVEGVTLAYAATSLFAALGVLCSYLARRRRTLPILGAGIIAVFAILSTIAYCGPGAPYLLENATVQNTNDIFTTQHRILVLQQGASLLPRWTLALFPLPEKPPQEWPYKIPANPPKSSIITAATCPFAWLDSNSPGAEAKARAAWLTNGPRLLILEEQSLQRLEQQRATLPRWFDWGFVLRTREFDPIWLWVVPFTAAFVATDWIASWMGRRLFLVRRRRRGRGPLTN